MDKYAGYAPEELSLPEGSTTYFFEESAGRAPDVDAPRRFDGAISYSELNDFADGPTRSTARSWPMKKGCEGSLVTEKAKDE